MNIKKLVLILTFLASYSCKLEQSQSVKDDTNVKGNEALELDSNRNLNTQEIKFLTESCEALEARAIELRRAIGVKIKYLFSLKSTSCNESGRSSSHLVYFSAPSDIDAPLKYYPYSNDSIPNFKYTILTNESKYVKNLCESALSLNLERPKLIEKVGDEYVKYRFYKSGGFEYFIYKNIRGKWISRNFESYELNLLKTSDNYGMVKSESSGAFCDNGSQSFYTQTLK